MFSKEELIKIQERDREKIILRNILPKKIKIVGGVDQSFIGEDKIISSIVVCNYSDMKIIEKYYSILKTIFPYIPGFLSFREGPAIIKTFKKLKDKPDLLLIDGNGILHPRGIGLASYVGISLDIPTIGVAKSLLCGEYKQVKNVGEYSKIIYKNKTVGYAYKSKKDCKPIFISPGHKVNLTKSLEIVKECIRGFRIPEPIRLSHHFSNEINNKLKRK